MFDNYPKTRSVLPGKFQAIYKEHYKSNRDGDSSASGLAQKMESWMHKKVAADVSKQHDKRTLEIGAGTLNQLDYEHSNHYDIIEPFSELFQESTQLSHINSIYQDIDDIDSDVKYDRITSIATFEHITDLPKVVAKSCLLLNSNGTLRSSIPNEGTFLWTLGWKLTTGIEFRLKYGLDYGIMMRHEHVNNAKEVEEVLYHFYDRNTCHTFGPSKGIAFYRFYESAGPKIDLAHDYLNTL